MTTPATETSTLIVEREMPFPPAKVWRALTETSLIAGWIMENDFKPVVGHKFNFRSTPVPGWDGIIQCEVFLVEPNSRLSYSWCSMGLKTVVEWTLTAAPSGTHLRMEQSGFRSVQDAAYKGATYGWNKFIGNLEQVVGRLD